MAAVELVRESGLAANLQLHLRKSRIVLLDDGTRLGD
jgi:hypothetical protein